MSEITSLPIDTSEFTPENYLEFLDGFSAPDLERLEKTEVTRIKYLTTRLGNLLKQLSSPEIDGALPKLRIQINSTISSLLKFAEPKQITANKEDEETPPERTYTWAEQINLQINATRAFLQRQVDKKIDGSEIVPTNLSKKGRNIKCDIIVKKLDSFPLLAQRDMLMELLPLGTQIQLTTKKDGKTSTVAVEIKKVEIVEDNQDETLRLHLTTTEKGAVYVDAPDFVALETPNLARIQEKYLRIIEDNAGGMSDIQIPQEIFMSGDFRSPYPIDKHKEGLDESQNEAFQRAMDLEPVLFIQGPPGSGKTTTTCAIIEGHIKEGMKVLVLSHSNKGVDVPAIMLKGRGVKVFRAGSNASVVDEKLHKDRITRGINFPRHKLKAIKEEKKRRTIKIYRDGGRATYTENEFIIDEFKRKRENAYDKTKRAIERGGVIFSTFGNLINDEELGKMEFDVVIIDEATKARMPEILDALKRAQKQIIFVGDPRQLGNIDLTPTDKANLEGAVNMNLQRGDVNDFTIPPEENERKNYCGEVIYRTRRRVARVLSPETNGNTREKAQAAVRMYEEGPFTTAMTQNPDLKKVFLDRNRRSLPNIVKVLSAVIYDNQLKPGRESKEHQGEGVVQWIDTRSIETTERTSGTSRRNPKEADVVVDMILSRLLSKDPDKKLQPEEIAVIATYAEQAELIRKKLETKLFNSKDLLERIIPNVASVDSFQGDQRKVVFVSMTRSNEQGNVGFLEEERRIGVAIGRAQDELYIIGDSETLVDNNTSEISRQFFDKLQGAVRAWGEINEVQPHRNTSKRHHERIRRRNARNRARMEKKHKEITT